MGIDISCILRYDMHSAGVKKAATLRRSSEILNIGFGELIVVLLVAFLIVGPKDLPKVARWLGRQVKMLRRMVAELKTETGWDGMEKELTQTQQELKQTQKDLDVTSDLREASQELQRNLNSLKKDVKKMDEDAKKEREAKKQEKP